MPVHDWTRVDAGVFHSFHLSWVAAIKKILNTSLLPEHYYALGEQHAGQLFTGMREAISPGHRKRMDSPNDAYRELRRSLAIRHVSDHRLIALLEVVSLVNKSLARSVEEFIDKVAAALTGGVHVLMVDLFPPGRHDSQGMKGFIWRRLDATDETFDVPADYPLTLASFRGKPASVYSAHITVGMMLPDMPLSLRDDLYMNVPLEATYQEAYRGMPAFWRDVLEGHSDHP